MVKRILSVVLSVLMILGSLTVAVAAESAEAENTYNYVALGDSIAAGYGLVDAGSLNKDPSLLITEDLIENPVEGAYPALFGAYLEKLGQKYGYAVNTTNLAAPAIRAEDLPAIITTPGYVPEIAANLFETYNVEGAREALSGYHDIFVKYLEQADLITIQIGINDISEGVFTPMTVSENPVERAIGVAVVRTFNGSDMATVIDTASKILEENKDDIDYSTVKEAVQSISYVLTHPEVQIENSAAQVKAAVDAVRSINPDADIALVSQYNVLGNSLDYNGKTYNAYNVLSSIFTDAVRYLNSEDAKQASVKDIISELKAAAGNELSYPVQYLLFGKNIDGSIIELNEKLQAVAEENDLTYVDIYDKVSNKNELNPHPDANGHKEIADALKAELTDLVIEKMTGEPQDSSFTVTRISNPDGQEREVDGLINDRGTSYTWRMAKRGDDIYIATYRNLLNGVITLLSRALSAQGVSSETIWALTDAITNGELPAAEDSDGAYIIKFNTKTGEFSKVFTFPSLMQCRMVVNYDGDIYAGSYSSVLPRQYLYKIDENDEVTEVFSTSESFSIRANCVYDAGNGDHLYFAGADEREVLEEGDENCCRIAVWEKDADDDTVWNRVADYKDFYDYAEDPGMKNSSGCPVWELANHGGYIYAGMPYSKGFIIFRGRPAEDGEEANEYGWIWEEVVGAKNGINNPGMAATSDGNADPNFSAIVSVYEFNGELYCFDFDQTILAELAFIQGALYKAAGQDVTLSDMVKPVYDTLHHTQTLWKLNDETGAFEVCEGFTELMEGTTNEYVWRAQEHNGYMYVSTMDSAVIYNYITQFTNGSYLKMSAQERQEKISYLAKLIRQLALSSDNEYVKELVSKLESLKELLSNYDPEKPADEVVDDILDEYGTLEEAIDKAIEELMTELEEKLNELFEDDGDLAPTGADLGDIALTGLALDIVPVDELKAQVIAETGADADDEEIKDSLLAKAYEKLKAYFGDITGKVKSVLDAVDWEGLEMYKWVSDTVKNDTWGFDIVRTRDGETFEVVTDDGFGDRYNYGCPSFLSTDEGLYIGTSNPFYGAQLYLLKDSKSVDPDDPDDPYDPYEPYPVDLPAWYKLGDSDTDGEVSVTDATLIQRYLVNLAGEEFIDLTAADVTRDEVDITDATFIERYLISLEVPHPIGETYYRATGEGVETIDKSVLVDTADVKITAERFYRSYGRPYVALTIENNSDKDVNISAEPVSINGYQTDAFFNVNIEDAVSSVKSITVSAGETVESDLELEYWYYTEDMPVIADIAATFRIADGEFVKPFASQKAVIRTSAYESYEYNFDESGDVIFDKDDIKLVYQGFTSDDDDNGSFNFYVNNQSDKDIICRSAKATINGVEQEAFFGNAVYSGNRALISLSFSSELALKEGDNVELTLEIREHNGDYVNEKLLYSLDTFTVTI